MSHRRFWSFGLLFALVSGGGLFSAADEPPPLRGPQVYAVTGARLMVAPGKVLNEGTLVVRDGLVESVGSVGSVSIPGDARILDLTGQTVYPGLIESYLAVPWPPQADDLNKDGPLSQGRNPDPRINPERDASRLTLPREGLEALRQAGFTTALVAPGNGIFRGGGAVLNLGTGGSRENLLQAGVTQHLGLEPLKRGEEGYGQSKMGVASLVRQTFLDASWYASRRSQWRTTLGKAGAEKRPPFDRALEALAAAASGHQIVVFETGDLSATLRAGRLTTELGLRAAAVGTGKEYQRLEQIRATGLPLLLPLGFPEAPKVLEADDLTLGLEELRHWDAAPDNPASLIEVGVTVAFTGHGLKDPSDLFPAIARAMERGLTEDEALAALTTTPAALLGVKGLTGTLEAGAMANFVVVDGPLWTKKPKILEVWIDGRPYPVAKPKTPSLDPMGSWNLHLLLGDDAGLQLRLLLEGSSAELSGVATTTGAGGDQDLVALDSAEISGTSLEVTFDGSSLGLGGKVSLSLEIRNDQAKGLGRGPNGEFAVQGSREQESAQNELPNEAPEETPE